MMLCVVIKGRQCLKLRPFAFCLCRFRNLNVYLFNFVEGRGAAGDVGEVKFQGAPVGALSSPVSLTHSQEAIGRGSRSEADLCCLKELLGVLFYHFVFLLVKEIFALK